MLNAIVYPFRGQNGYLRLIVLMVLGVIPILNFFALGFVGENIRSYLKDEENIITWNEWGHKFYFGFVLGIVTNFYRAVIKFYELLFKDGVYSPFGELFLIYLVSLFAYMGCLMFCHSEDILAAFSLKLIWQKIRTLGWKYFIVIFFVVIVIDIIQGVAISLNDWWASLLLTSTLVIISLVILMALSHAAKPLFQGSIITNTLKSDDQINTGF